MGLEKSKRLIFETDEVGMRIYIYRIDDIIHNNIYITTTLMHAC
jgi:hypothetical protein